MGAHGYLNGQRYWNVDKLQDYLARVNDTGRAVAGVEDLSEATRVMEKVIFGLRMNQGIAIALVPANKRVLIDAFIADGFMRLHEDRLQVTDQGRLVLDEIATRLI